MYGDLAAAAVAWRFYEYVTPATSAESHVDSDAVNITYYTIDSHGPFFFTSHLYERIVNVCVCLCEIMLRLNALVIFELVIFARPLCNVLSNMEPNNIVLYSSESFEYRTQRWFLTVQQL